MLGRNAAFLYTDPATGQDVVIDLPAPLRDIRTRLVQRRYVEEALDGTRSVKTIGPAHYELIGRIRFVDAPDAVLSMLHAAANGAQLVYTEDVTDPHAKTYAAELIWDDAAIELGMDADLGKIGRGEVTVVLRSSTPWGALFAGPDVLFRYRAGEPLSGAGMSFSRASTATLIDRTGTLQEVGPNVPRIDWSHGRPVLRLEGGSTNHIRNPRGEGAVIGVVGSDGALPTFWAREITGGLTWEVVGTGVEDGISYVDVRLHGTPTQTLVQMRFEGTTTIAAGPGQTWTGTFYARRVGGSMAGIGEARVRIQERDASGVSLNQSQSVFDPNDSPRLAGARRTHTHTVSDQNAAAIVLMFGLGGMTVGNAIDVTFRIGAPQMEQMPFATSPILPPIGAPAVATRATDQIVTIPAPAPQPMAVYLRFRERGTAFVGSFSADLIGFSSALAPPLFQIDGTSTPGRYRVIHGLPSGTNSMSMTTVSAAMDDDVEILATLSSDGAVRIHVSINGGPVQSGSAGSAIGMPSAWGVDRLALGSSGAYTLLRDAIVLRGTGWTMDQIRQRFGIS